MQDPVGKANDKKIIKADAVQNALSSMTNYASGSLPYLMICYLDMNELPSYLKDYYSSLSVVNGPRLLSEFSWVIRVFSSDTLGFVRDTTKEDSEKALKDSWELSETGRADKAKRSRFRFLAQCKRDRGEKLTSEEEKILLEERERKAFINPEAMKDLGKKNEKTGKDAEKGKKNTASANANDKKLPGNNSASNAKNANSNANNANANVNLVNENDSLHSHNKSLPKPDSHTSDYVKSFLSYTYQERTIVFNNSLRQSESKSIILTFSFNYFYSPRLIVS